MQREPRTRHGWRHWTGRILPVLGVALLAIGPAHSKDKKKKHHDDDAPAQPASPAPEDPPSLIGPPAVIRPPGQNAPPVSGLREPPRTAPGVSLDRVIAQVERRYKARVVRADKKESGGRLVYELRLLSEEGRVWTVKVDAETGKEG